MEARKKEEDWGVHWAVGDGASETPVSESAQWGEYTTRAFMDMIVKKK